jgi:monoamine oxidase
LPVDKLSELIKAVAVFNWQNDPFASGAYSYATLHRMPAIDELRNPVEETIYFAGEALEPENTGTVEAALVSGNFVASLINPDGV